MIIAIKDKIVIAPFKAGEQKLTSGLVIPGSAEKRGGQGMIVALGKDVKCKEIHIKDLVLYKEWSGILVKHKDKEYIILDEDDLLALLPDDYIEDLGMSVSEQSQKYFKSMIQPFRNGKFSKEFAEAYPDKTKDMILNGTVTQGEVDSSVYLFKDLAGWKNRNKSK